MIYLTTGGNGAGKTLFTLFDVRQAQLKEPTRPVYYHGFKASKPIDDFGWLPFEPSKWQDLPDGSICIFDECQNEFPAKIPGELPEWINAVAQHRRRRGFDFWLITPHPSLIHVNVRRLIESPSWHRHMKRTFGLDTVSQLTFNFAELKCEQPSSGARGQVQMRSYPKEVYGWYESATKHTGKKRIPKQVYVFVGALSLVPVLGWFAWQHFAAMAAPRVLPGGSPLAASDGSLSSPGSASLPGSSAADYVASFQPRLVGFPHTAPRYDEVTQPTIAPYPAACISSARSCMCYTQQGTRLPVPLASCRDIVAGGFFVDWDTSAGRSDAGSESRPTSPPATSPPALLARDPTDLTLPPRAASASSSADGAVIGAMRSNPVSF